MVLYASLSVAQVPSEGARALMMRRFHTDLPFPVWALLQPAPAMYSYGNVARFEPAGGAAVQQQTINHHSYRVFGDGAAWWAVGAPEGRMVLTSTFRGTTVVTELVVTQAGGRAYVQR
jgi:hypothetical protein